MRLSRKGCPHVDDGPLCRDHPDQLAAIKDNPKTVEGMFAPDAGPLLQKPLDLLERLRRHAPQLVADTLQRLPPELREQLEQMGLGKNSLPILAPAIRSRIRLTDIFGLNDPTELKHGLSPAIKLLNAARRNDRLEIRQFSENLAAMLGEIEQVAHFFVCSFSKSGNDLGQWRAYADNGRGFALGFDAATLEQAFARANIAGKSQHTTFPVTYNEGHLRRMHSRIIQKALPFISMPRTRVFPDGSIDPYISELLRRMCVPIIHAALFFKHPSYKNEKEYRFLQLFRADIDVPDIKHLPRGYKLTRYSEFEWRALAVGSLKRIVFGPAASTSARQFAKECLQRFHPKTVGISQSRLPYRP